MGSAYLLHDSEEKHYRNLYANIDFNLRLLIKLLLTCTFSLFTYFSQMIPVSSQFVEIVPHCFKNKNMKAPEIFWHSL